MVVEASIDIVGEVVGENCGDSRDGVIREGETPLCCGRRGSIRQWSPGAEDRDIGCGQGVCGHRGSKVFTAWGDDKDVVGVDGNILVKWSKEESVKDFLSYSRRGGRHGEWGDETIEPVSFITLVVQAFFGAYSGGFRRSLRLGLERTSPTLEPKSLLMEEILSIVQGTEDSYVFHRSEI